MSYLTRLVTYTLYFVLHFKLEDYRLNHCSRSISEKLLSFFFFELLSLWCISYDAWKKVFLLFDQQGCCYPSFSDLIFNHSSDGRIMIWIILYILTIKWSACIQLMAFKWRNLWFTCNVGKIKCGKLLCYYPWAVGTMQWLFIFSQKGCLTCAVFSVEICVTTIDKWAFDHGMGKRSAKGRKTLLWLL